MIIVVKANPSLQYQFPSSAWILPAGVLGLFLTILLDNLWRGNYQITQHE